MIPHSLRLHITLAEGGPNCSAGIFIQCYASLGSQRYRKDRTAHGENNACTLTFRTGRRIKDRWIVLTGQDTSSIPIIQDEFRCHYSCSCCHAHRHHGSSHIPPVHWGVLLLS